MPFTAAFVHKRRERQRTSPTAAQITPGTSPGRLKTKALDPRHPSSTLPSSPLRAKPQRKINSVTPGKDLLLLQAAISAPCNGGNKQIPKKGKLRPRQRSFTLFGVQMEQLHPFFLFTGPFSHQQVHFFSGSQSDPHHLPQRWTELSRAGNTAKSWRPQRDTSTLWQRGGEQQEWGT